MSRERNTDFNMDSPLAKSLALKVLSLIKTTTVDLSKIQEICTDYSIEELVKFRRSLTGTVLIEIFNHNYEECKNFEQKYRDFADLLISTKKKKMLEEHANKHKKTPQDTVIEDERILLFLPLLQEITRLQYILTHKSPSDFDDKEILSKFVNAKEELFDLAKTHRKKFRYFKNAVHSLGPSIMPRIKVNNTADLGDMREYALSTIEEFYKTLTRQSKKTSVIPSRASIPSKNSLLFDVTIPWTDVYFINGSIRVMAKGHSYIIQSPNAKEQYNVIQRTFAKRLENLTIRIQNGCARLVNDVYYERVISIFELIDIVNGEKGHEALCNGGKKLLTIPSNVISKIFPLNKTPYFNLLQDIQINDIPIIPCFENQPLKNPDSFLFTTTCASGECLIWESTGSNENKASYVFIKPEDSPLVEFQNKVFQYVSSPLKRKREQLRTHSTLCFKGVSYFAIDHDGYNFWQKRVLDIINRKPYKENSKLIKRRGLEEKSEGCVEYISLSKKTVYEKKHNFIQNKVKEILLKTGTYSLIELERDYIDIVAKNKIGDLEYYEIKTYTTPKKCIREAIGQLLEYAYYFDRPLPKKLIIVGLSALNNQDKRYLSRLQKNMGISLNYKQFNLDKNFLL